MDWMDPPEWPGSDAMDEEKARFSTPAHTALLHRTFPTYTEAAWVNAFPSIRCIVVTALPVRQAGLSMPGVVRTLDVGWRGMRTPEEFRSRFERVLDSYVAEGWARKPHGVRA